MTAPYSSLPLFSSRVSLFWAVAQLLFSSWWFCHRHRQVVLVMMGLGLFMFGIPMNTQSYAPTSAEQFSPLWLGILFFICGLLYILSERNLSKKISITASLALSIISITGVLSALVEFSRAIVGIYHIYRDQMNENQTEEEELYARQHYRHGAGVLLSQLEGRPSACNPDVLHQGHAAIQKDSGNLTSHSLAPVKPPKALGCRGE
ncbi:uncharacterized protein LOC122147142 [Cyprinus carpio]|uniref:Uncharacterized protein LOC122147142 n=1 Tax=Cyprinus carpio TaxID=7962 RepID=A0A9Q9YPX0_CYPCA|nr:uncharacterized protein LOC122147142 [Cyprinus carpio]